MHNTIFRTPVVSSFFRGVARLYFYVFGWKLVGSYPAGADKSVIIAAPHTSNWDLPITLFAAFQWRINVYWLGKQSIFKPPFGAVMRWLGGVAVDRAKSTNLVASTALAVREAKHPVALIVPPEGTRGAVTVWKTGFYYMAHEAQVPIVMAYTDYAKKEVGHFGVFVPTGDVDADVAQIRSLYAQVQGKHPTKYAA